MKNAEILEEYSNPTMYDIENDPYMEDVPLLLKWASKANGKIIDLACGTGRATIPLAKEGHELIGVDVHHGMLSEAKRKANQLDLPIQWVEQDCVNLKLDEKARFIYCVGNSFQHFLTNEEQDGLLSSVYQHLESKGIFIFGTRFPNVEELLQPSEEEYWKSYQDPISDNQVQVYTISDYDSLTQVQHYVTIRRFENNSGEIIDERKTKISLRYVYPKEMERLLSLHGFEILHVYGDWKESPLNQDSSQMIYVCRK